MQFPKHCTLISICNLADGQSPKKKHIFTDQSVKSIIVILPYLLATAISSSDQWRTTAI
jgi:hypothetical protein